MEVRNTAGKTEKVLVLYLTDWQQRMVKDFLGQDCHSWVVSVEDAAHVKYGGPIPENPDAKKMYLTDWQKREMQQELGVVCDYIELVEKIEPKYFAPYK